MTLMQAAFCIFVLGVIWSIYRLHLNPNVDFNMLDLLMENDRVSRISCMVIGAFLLNSWVILDLEIHGHLTEGFMLSYSGSWVAPLLIKLLNINQPKRGDLDGHNDTDSPARGS